jgi:biopolymer transport protein ExbD
MKRLYFYYLKNKREKRESGRHEFDSSSVGDLAFLLLIFFIVTSSFILRQGILLSLPPKNAASEKIVKDQIVNIYPDNRSFTVDGVNLSREELFEKLKYDRKSKSRIIAVINMRSGVKYDRLVDTLSLLKETKIYEVSLKSLIGAEE